MSHRHQQRQHKHRKRPQRSVLPEVCTTLGTMILPLVVTRGINNMTADTQVICGAFAVILLTAGLWLKQK